MKGNSLDAVELHAQVDELEAHVAVERNLFVARAVGEVLLQHRIDEDHLQVVDGKQQVRVALLGQHFAQHVQIVEEKVRLDNGCGVDANSVHQLVGPSGHHVLANVEQSPLLESLRNVAAGARFNLHVLAFAGARGGLFFILKFRR